MTVSPSTNHAADITPLSDTYVNTVIQQHGYDSPECVIARLHQWIGLYGSENGVTLLMYEAHKTLSKLRAEGVQAGDEQESFNALSDLVNALRERHYGRMPEEVQQAYDRAWTIVFTAPTATLASAPVAGEALFWYRPCSDGGYEGPIHNDRIEDVRKRSGAWVPLHAAPYACKAARILFPAFLRKMWSGDEVQAWLDEHQGITPPKATGEGSLERYRKWQAEQPETDKDGGDCAKGARDVVLPPLPHINDGRSSHIPYSKTCMTDYARTAVLADRQQRAETAATQALHDAASSLESISTMAGVAGWAMTSMAAVRNYAAVRARIARAKLPSTYRPADQNGENS
ncbi:hypothetical protein [Achromobacter kerstersii]